MEQKIQEATPQAKRPAGSSEPIFALDIGTRSIIGIVGIQENEAFRVLAVEREEHTERAMVDGQIEDIEAVAATAGRVRASLEEKLGLSLTNVCVAAAGRALKTQRATYEIALDSKEPIRNQQVLELEMGAIQQASGEIQESISQGDPSLYCVGHSVVRYLLDGYPISTLLSHRGKRASVEIIATFLPGEVVESLYTTMSKIGLSVGSITLEPIAAMNAIIPKELRMLNLALVDIGAGTSDIALSSGGSVTAYTMATVAGDEITETIVREYLVDFETAEQVKLCLSAGTEEIGYQDILGFSYTLAPQTLAEAIAPAVENLCSVISSKILEVNEKPPAAVFMVGGGSQLPGLCKLVAKKLGVEENKVAVGGNNYIKRMVVAEENISGPEFATPIGIAITAVMTRERNSFSISLNGKQIRLFKNGPMTVMDLLLMNGYRHSQIIGRSGQSVTFELNGQKRVFRGGYPVAAIITVNGQPASISTPLGAEDKVQVVDAVQGIDAQPTVGDVVEHWNSLGVTLNGVDIQAGTVVLVNGQPADQAQPIHNLDVVELRQVETLGDLCAQAGLDPEEYRFLVNDEGEDASWQLCQGDDIRYYRAPAEPAPQPQPSPEPPRQPVAEGPSFWITLNGSRVELFPKGDGTPYLFIDMLNFVDIDPTKPQGDIVLELNGRNASYLEAVSEGDTVNIHWNKR